MRKPRIGICCLLRKTFDYQTAFEIYKDRVNEIIKDDSVTYINYDEMVIEPEEAKKCATYFIDQHVDAVILVSGTFHLGHLALIIDDLVKKPVLLWGFNELPYDGGKIRLNSVCGVNLNASNLYKGGNDTYCVTIGDKLDLDWVKAIKMKVALNNANLGIVGYRAQGFFNVGVDELHLYKELGVLISHFELNDIFSQPVTEIEIGKEIEFVRRTFDCKKLNDDQVNLVAKLVVSSEKFMRKNNLDVVAIRCWPEFAKTYGISPCAMMSILQSRGLLLACEGDVEAALSMIACRAAGEDTPFMADLSQVNLEENYALLWHDGVAPCNLWDGICNRSLETYFAGGKGVTADFVLKSGAMSIFRIDTARNKTRVYYEEGEAVPMEKLLSGTYAKVYFKRNIKDILDTVTYSGVAHHVIMGYCQYEKAVKYLARIQGWDIIDENYKG
ncbi:MAG: hypothetical protein PUA56_06630 [Bacillales bacterium]|nr:hypothetical protein [Bacillales bacterium]